MSGYEIPEGQRDGRADGPASRSAGRREPAPGGLEFVRGFLNSADLEAGTDAFATADSVAAWLRRHERTVPALAVSEDGRGHLIAVREALRNLITMHEPSKPDAASLAVLAVAAQASPLIVELDREARATLRSANGGVNGLIGDIFAEIAVASTIGTWSRLKICRNEACRWAYYDASRNHSGLWCSMAVCGNRAKGRALRVRRRGPAARRSSKAFANSPQDTVHP